MTISQRSFLILDNPGLSQGLSQGIPQSKCLRFTVLACSQALVHQKGAWERYLYSILTLFTHTFHTPSTLTHTSPP